MKPFAFCLGFCFILLSGAPGAETAAAIPDPTCANVPDLLPISPDGSLPFRVQVVSFKNCSTPVQGALVEIEFSPDADALIAWGPDQDHPLLSQFTDQNGEATFYITGGGCVDGNRFFGATFIVQVRADGIALDEVQVVSPDVVNSAGQLPTDIGTNLCENGVTSVALSDAVFHTRPIKLGLVEPCSKFSGNPGDSVTLDDAVLVTPFIKNGVFSTCQ